MQNAIMRNNYHSKEAQLPSCHAVAVAGAMLFSKWLKSVGVSDTTGWRMRREHRIKTVNIAGRLYVTADEIEQFWTRAKAGEFAKEAVVPKREKAAQR